MNTEDLIELKSLVHQKSGIWISEEYKHPNGEAVSEFFFKRLNQKYYIGLDDYLLKYEDATDLYFKYIREEFDDFTTATDYVINTIKIPENKLIKK
ncbi:hypothetical protein [Chromobacterium violaceum]|uniref:hypothetical protein n=1 Tax=Chromobacterium violaceum TaxID=536 RepID=UPI001B3428D8|nr:hypothetical protein [Chromobacterium violaceum]MBP4047306.1 hypothetical protein [Chromobacterium violaceum]